MDATKREAAIQLINELVNNDRQHEGEILEIKKSYARELLKVAVELAEAKRQLMELHSDRERDVDDDKLEVEFTTDDQLDEQLNSPEH